MVENPERRRFLELAAAGGITALAGCNVMNGDDTETPANTPEPTTSDGNGGETDTPDESTPTSTSAPTVNIEVTGSPAQLPPVWDGQGIDNFRTEVSITAESDPDLSLQQVQAANQDTEAALLAAEPGKSSFQETVGFHPREQVDGEWQEFIQPGENNLSANATDTEGRNASDTATVTLETPDNYKLDIRQGTNEELRRTMETGNGRNNYEAPDGYLQEVEQRMNRHLGNIEDDPVFTSYSSHDNLSHDKETIDLVAAEWRHDNDRYQVNRPEHVNTFLETIDTPVEQLEEGSPAKQAKTRAIALYPNASGNDRGHFVYENFAQADTVGEALDWAQPYLFNLQDYLEGPGPISSEDIQYATSLQWGLDEHTDIDSHFWSFNIGGGAHGNGMVWDYDNQELRVLEPIGGPETMVGPEEMQYHPLIENSNYLPPGLREEMGGTNLDTDNRNERAYERFTIPHPLLFGSDYQDEYMKRPFRENKESASDLLTGIANNKGWANQEVTYAATTEYLESVMERIRNYRNWSNPNQQFEKILNQAKTIVELEWIEGNQVVYGDVDNPQYATVKDRSILDDIWTDAEGQYDDFDQYLTSDPQYSFSDIDTELSGQTPAA